MGLMSSGNLETKSFPSLNTEVKNFDAPYVIPEESHSQFKNHMSDGLSFPTLI